ITTRIEDQRDGGVFLWDEAQERTTADVVAGMAEYLTAIPMIAQPANTPVGREADSGWEFHLDLLHGGHALRREDLRAVGRTTVIQVELGEAREIGGSSAQR